MRKQRATNERRVLTVIPAYNEEKCIKQVIDNVLLYFPLTDILVVDDGSVDDTWRQALGAGVEVLRLPCNLGIGAALQVALKYARDMGYDFTLRLDADGQHDPEDAFRLLSAVMNREADAAIGSRFLGTQWLGKERNYRTSISRALGIKTFAILVSFLVGQPITDPTSGLRCYNRRVIVYLARYHPQDYPEVESVVALHRAGFRLLELPATIYPRVAGTSSISTWKAIYYVFRVLLAALIAALRTLPGEIPEPEAHVA
ncbi:MAG: glycosyltransferase family 2 protein [Anaerolineae bacterium]|jgi:glycosyltransferase involved in cell wall biosynthesis